MSKNQQNPQIDIINYLSGCKSLHLAYVRNDSSEVMYFVDNDSDVLFKIEDANYYYNSKYINKIKKLPNSNFIYNENGTIQIMGIIFNKLDNIDLPKEDGWQSEELACNNTNNGGAKKKSLTLKELREKAIKKINRMKKSELQNLFK